MDGSRLIDGVEMRSGGLTDRRPLKFDDPFEAAVARALGHRIRRHDASFREQAWSALTNIVWTPIRPAGANPIAYTFRAAGDLIAAICGQGNYLDHYCCGPSGVMTGWISDAMAVQGWTWKDARVHRSPKSAVPAAPSTMHPQAAPFGDRTR